jgi:large subunit ribosomal protein L19
MKALIALTEKQQKTVPDLRPGDSVRVHTKIIEGNKERIQVFEGIVLRVKGSGNAQSFTVRKLSYGIGVERTFLAQSPRLTKIEIKKRAKVRRAYLTYLRELRGKAAKLKDQRFDALAVNVKEEELRPEDLAPPEEELDEEITNLTDEAEDVKGEVDIDDIAKDENKEAEAEDKISDEDRENDTQELEKLEIEESTKELPAEKVIEDTEPEKEEEK